MDGTNVEPSGGFAFRFVKRGGSPVYSPLRADFELLVIFVGADAVVE